jgi:hypothetical protein
VCTFWETRICVYVTPIAFWISGTRENLSRIRNKVHNLRMPCISETSIRDLWTTPMFVVLSRVFPFLVLPLALFSDAWSWGHWLLVRSSQMRCADLSLSVPQVSTSPVVIHFWQNTAVEICYCETKGQAQKRWKKKECLKVSGKRKGLTSFLLVGLVRNINLDIWRALKKTITMSETLLNDNNYFISFHWLLENRNQINYKQELKEK